MRSTTDTDSFPLPEAAPSQPDLEMASSIETLGYRAVAAMNRHAEILYGLATEELSPAQRTQMTNFVRTIETELPHELQEVRQHLRGLDEKQSGELGYYLDGALPLFFFRSEPGAELVLPPSDWTKWLANETDDAELLNFVQWHNHVNGELARSEGVQSAVARHREQCVEASKLLAREGFFSPSTNVEDTASIEYGDIFDTYLKERAAYYAARHHRMTLGHSLKGSETGRVLDFVDDLMPTLTHEQAHAMLCRTREDRLSPLGERWINEALTQEAARMIRIALRDPTVKDDRIYEDERSLLKLLLSGGNQIKGLKLALSAYTGDEAEREAFTDYLDALWETPDVLRKMNSAVIMTEEFYQQRGKSGRSAETTALRTVADAFKRDPNIILKREDTSSGHYLKDAALE